MGHDICIDLYVIPLTFSVFCRRYGSRHLYRPVCYPINILCSVAGMGHDICIDLYVIPLTFSVFCRRYGSRHLYRPVCYPINILCSVAGMGHDICIDLSAHKERLVKEELQLRDANNKDKFINITLHARVLG